MKFGLTLLLASLLAGAPTAQAQSSRAFVILVRSGPDLIKLLVEKRGDLTIGIIAGTIVTLGDKTMTSLLASPSPNKPPPPVTPNTPKAPGCSSLAGNMAACASDFNLQGERFVTNDQLRKALEGTNLKITSPEPYVKMHDDFKKIEIHPPATPAPAVGSDFADIKISNSMAPVIEELRYWWSIQDSSDPEKFREYLARYPNGSHKLDAQFRLFKTRGSTVDPSTPQLASSCLENETEVLAPVRATFAAVNAKDLSNYTEQLYDNAVYRDSSGQLNKFQLAADRAQAFEAWDTAKIEMTHWQINAEGQGQATVQVHYAGEINPWSGESSHEEGKEIYKLACASGGKWRILEEIADPTH